MTFEEYLEFLERYWKLFGPPPPPPIKKAYSIVRL